MTIYCGLSLNNEDVLCARIQEKAVSRAFALRPVHELIIIGDFLEELKDDLDDAATGDSDPEIREMCQRELRFLRMCEDADWYVRNSAATWNLQEGLEEALIEVHGASRRDRKWMKKLKQEEPSLEFLTEHYTREGSRLRDHTRYQVIEVEGEKQFGYTPRVGDWYALLSYHPQRCCYQWFGTVDTSCEITRDGEKVIYKWPDLTVVLEARL